MAARYQKQLEVRRRSYAKNAEARNAYARARYAKMMEALRKAEKKK